MPPDAASDPLLIERASFETSRLMAEHPPVWHHPNKALVFEIACPRGSVYRGTVRYSRWRGLVPGCLWDAAAALRRVRSKAGFYDYSEQSDLPGSVEWHVNFADPHLFVAYGSGLFAQDEMQVAEHPALGALREALLARGSLPLTVEAGGPTPVLVMGVERRCRIATEPDPLAGRPHGLYGNRFAAAPPDVVRRATVRLDPPTISNIIAMASLPGGDGRYAPEEVRYLLSTAYSGFRAAVLESHRDGGPAVPVVVHTGFWGCGAFGGNRVLMALIQILAAGAAGVERLVFHTGDPAGEISLEQARALLAEKLGGEQPLSTDALVARLVGLGFTWGVSDGN
ncbi:MAG: hypothetical protein KatS3mg081_2653 [Gemmatimonadales bacterium]|nr:MAG: hypothetical protein KatS3mg081_2653 [Gemmatimonadales bacterium]